MQNIQFFNQKFIFDINLQFFPPQAASYSTKTPNLIQLKSIFLQKSLIVSSFNSIFFFFLLSAQSDLKWNKNSCPILHSRIYPQSHHRPLQLIKFKFFWFPLLDFLSLSLSIHRAFVGQLNSPHSIRLEINLSISLRASLSLSPQIAVSLNYFLYFSGFTECNELPVGAWQ